MITANFLDACPSCDPGLPDASPPVGPVRQAGEYREADYGCSSCPTAWTTRWRDGWPVERLTAQVGPVLTLVREAA